MIKKFVVNENGNERLAKILSPLYVNTLFAPNGSNTKYSNLPK